MNTHKFFVHGMHCSACVILTESELKDVEGVSAVRATLRTRSVEITGVFGDKTPDQIAQAFSTILQPHGYRLSLEEERHSVRWPEFKLAVPIAIGFVALFIILQKLGIVNLVNTSEVGYGTAFVIGLIASVSTCMAVVGGLVLSMSATFAQQNDKVRPQVLFHIGRLVSFFVLGGLIGVVGSAFQLGQIGAFVLSVVVAVVLIILGINLLDVLPWAKRLQLVMPSVIGKRVQSLKRMNHSLTPLVVGVATFFLPCGFTQSMQIYTLTTGSFWSGAFIMLSFALGSLPALALLSFSSLGIQKKTQSGVFFKTAGLVVLFFGIFNLLNAFVSIGVIPPVFNF